MDILLLDITSDFARGVDFNLVTQNATSASNWVVGNPAIIIIALILIGVSIFLFFYLQRILVNSAVGLVLWLLITFVFKAELPLLPSFIISVLFGAAGVGTMLILKFFNLI